MLTEKLRAWLRFLIVPIVRDALKDHDHMLFATLGIENMKRLIAEAEKAKECQHISLAELYVKAMGERMSSIYEERIVEHTRRLERATHEMNELAAIYRSRTWGSSTPRANLCTKKETS